MKGKALGLLLVFWFLGVVPAKAFDLGLFVSDEDLAFQAQQQIYTYSGNPLFLGGELLYSEKDNRDSWLFNTYLAVEDLYQKTVNLGLGFEAMIGEVKPSVGYDVFAVGFRFRGEVDLAKAPSKLPLSLETRLFYSPPILSFADTERVLTLDFSLYFHLNATAAVGVRYEILDVDIDKPGNPSWDNSTLMIGAKITF